jgi:recombinational DNA repair protein RecT
MTNTAVQIQPATAIPFSLEKVRETVISSMTAMIEKKMIAAPQNYKEEIFFAFQKLAELKDIDKCEVKNICNEMAKIFRNDLAVTKNHCALMVINSKNSSTGKALSMRWQYQGLTHVAKTKCNVKRVNPVLVFENDKFSAKYEEGILKIEHEPNFANGGSLLGGYCVVENGAIECRYYTRAELDKRRGKSQKQTVWENGRAVGQTESNFWTDWEREMYEKTLINATLKRIIETSGDADSEGINNDYETIEIHQMEPTTQRIVEAEIIQQDEPAETKLINTVQL